MERRRLRAEALEDTHRLLLECSHRLQAFQEEEDRTDKELEAAQKGSHELRQEVFELRQLLLENSEQLAEAQHTVGDLQRELLLARQQVSDLLEERRLASQGRDAFPS